MNKGPGRAEVRGGCSRETEWYRKATCLGMRRGGVFEPQRGYYVCYLQHLHLLLDMLWYLKTGLCWWSRYSFRALIDKEFPFSTSPFCKVLEEQFILVAPPRGHKGCCYSGFILPACSPTSAIRKAGSPRGYKAAYLHRLDHECDSDCWWILLGQQMMLLVGQLRAWEHKATENSKICTFARG